MEACPLYAKSRLMHRSNSDHRQLQEIANFRPKLAWAMLMGSQLSLNDHRKRKCGALARLRPEPGAKTGVGLETVVTHRKFE
jgi:hypothetical protein